MATSFVEFRKYGFWAPDAFIEGLYYLLAREFDSIEDKENWHNELIEEFSLASTVGFMGCIPSFLDDFFEKPERLQLLRQKLNYIINQISNNDHFLTVSELNDNEIGQGGWHEINKQGFRNIAMLMLDLIDGKIKTDSSSAVDYW